MDKFAELCRSMAQNPNIMTFSDINKAAISGAVAGQRINLPGGAVSGAVIGVSLEALKRVDKITKECATRAKPRQTG